MTPQQLVDLHRDGRLRPQDHLVIPAAETLASRLRLAMALQIDSMHWEQLRTAFPAAGEGLLELHERLSRQVASCGTGTDRDIAMPESALTRVRDLLQLLGSTPAPWCDLMALDQSSWASWASWNAKTLQWSWHLHPLEPLQTLERMFSTHPWTRLHGDGGCRRHGTPRKRRTTPCTLIFATPHALNQSRCFYRDVSHSPIQRSTPATCWNKVGASSWDARD